MMCCGKTITAALFIVLFGGLGVAPSPAQAKIGPGDPEVMRLRKEVAKLREDLDAAVRDIRNLKEAMRTGNAVPEKGPLYRGQPASYWQAQLNDADKNLHKEAVEAIGALAHKDKKLVPVLIDLLKNGQGLVPYFAAKELSDIGPEVLPTLIEIAKDKTQPKSRGYAIEAIGGMRTKAKPAVPVLIKALDDNTDVVLLRSTVTALGQIGPDAKDSIPALVRSLGAILEDIGKPESRFGTNAGSINNKILDVLMILDPNLASELTRPGIFKGGSGLKGKGSAKLPPSPEVREAWQQVHETLVKKYVKSK